TRTLRGRGSAKALDREMSCHGRSGRTHELMGSPEAPVEERNQRIVVASAIGEHELLESAVALLPRRRTATEHQREVVEIGGDTCAPDLVEPLEMARQAEGPPALVLRRLVRH